MSESSSWSNFWNLCGGFPAFDERETVWRDLTLGLGWDTPPLEFVEIPLKKDPFRACTNIKCDPFSACAPEGFSFIADDEDVIEAGEEGFYQW